MRFLQRLLRRPQPLTRDQAVAILRQRALDTVHRGRDPYLPVNEVEAMHFLPPDYAVTTVMEVSGAKVAADGSDFLPLG